MQSLRCLALSLAVICIVNCSGAFGCLVTRFDQVPVALAICDNIILDSLEVPAGETLKLHLQDGTSLTFRGTTTFGFQEWYGPLVEINGTDVVIQGEEGSLLDGQGPLYWDSLGIWGSLKPRFFTIQLHNSVMNHIHILNSPVHCAMLYDSTDVRLEEWTIDISSGAPEVAEVGKAGHNTDGFVIWNSTNIVLTNGVIYNQDDCVHMRCGANILVDNFTCYGSHGLSVSLGFSNDTYELNVLQNVTFKNSFMNGGTNGIHIKTHTDGGVGLLQNITYENIEINGPTEYGINIQENYVNTPPNGTFPSFPRNNIPIKDLSFSNIVGLVEDSAVPIYILCAEDGCFDWKFTNVVVEGAKPSNCSFVPTDFDYQC